MTYPAGIQTHPIYRPTKIIHNFFVTAARHQQLKNPAYITIVFITWPIRIRHNTDRIPDLIEYAANRATHLTRFLFWH